MLAAAILTTATTPARATATAWASVPLGGGYVTGIISDPTGADIYIRTDVGGAFRWVASAEAWVSITDEIKHAQSPLRARSAPRGR